MQIGSLARAFTARDMMKAQDKNVSSLTVHACIKYDLA